VAAFAATIVFVVVFWRLGVPTFWDPDEAHYAETTREMVRSGDWWAPYYNEQPFFDKPILFHQLQAVPMRLFGATEFAARFVPALAALTLILVTVWFGSTLVASDVGLTAGLLLAVSPGVFALARYAILDTLFSVFVFSGAALLAVAAMKDRPLLQWPGYVCLALGVLTKGPLAIVLCALTLALASAVSADARRRLWKLHWIAGLAIVAAISTPWFVYMYRRFGQDFVNGYLLDENIRLFARRRFGNQPRPWFYFQILAAGLLPWTGLVVGRLIDDVVAVVRGERLDTLEILLWAWTASVVGFFTASHFRLDHYVFPAAPALCLLCARAWVEFRADPTAKRYAATRMGLRAIGPLIVAMGVGCGYFLVVRLELPREAVVIPALITLCGVLITARVNFGLAVGGTPPRLPWFGLAAMAITYAGVILFVIPALEERKVVPDLARWVKHRAHQRHRIASYRLNRWNPAFRFYVDGHTEMLETPYEARAFFAREEPFYCVMLRPTYEEFVAQGVPLAVEYERDGMWATSGRALWRRIPPTRFVVVTRAR